MSDNVNHPAYYQQEGRKECIDEMLEQFGPVAVYWFSVLSAYKYRYRAGDKPDNAVEQDTAKAEWFDHKADEMHGLGAPDGWIRCSERMPKEDGEYLCVSNGEFKILPYRNGEFYCTCFDAVLRCCNSSVTHWMPLPEPPKEDLTDERGGRTE